MQSTVAQLPDLLSRKEAWTTLGIKRSKYQELVRQGYLKEVPIGRRRLLPRSEIARFIAEGGVPRER